MYFPQFRLTVSESTLEAIFSIDDPVLSAVLTSMEYNHSEELLEINTLCSFSLNIGCYYWLYTKWNP